MTARTELFATTMFRPGAQLAPKKGKQPHVVALQPIGMVHLPSGRLVIHGMFDPFPLVRTGPIGVFPVEASLVTVSSSDSRFAALRIVFSREPIVTWEVAEGAFGGERGFTDPDALYIDAQVLPAFQKYIEEADDPNEWFYDPPKLEGKTWRSACFAPDDDRPETCVLFTTNSYNDERPYISYWGLDASGVPAVFVTDLNLVA